MRLCLIIDSTLKITIGRRVQMFACPRKKQSAGYRFCLCAWTRLVVAFGRRPCVVNCEMDTVRNAEVLGFALHERLNDCMVSSCLRACVCVCVCV